MRLKEIDGLPIFDAKTPIVLHITKRDTTNATEQEPAQCAVARACRRELHAKEVRVHLSRAYVRTNEQNWLRYIVPPYMRTEKTKTYPDHNGGPDRVEPNEYAGIALVGTAPLADIPADWKEKFYKEDEEEEAA